MVNLIPWDEFEEEYAKNFSIDMGAPALPERVALGSLIISLFCHSPVSRMISNSQTQGMLSDAEFGNHILTNASTFENFYSEKIARSLALSRL